MVISRISSSLVSCSFVGVSISLMVALLLEEERDELGEAVAESEDQRGHEDEDAEDDDGVVDDLGTGGPRDLAHLLADLAEELARAGALATAALLNILRGRASRCRGAVGTHLALSLHQSLLFAVHLTSFV